MKPAAFLFDLDGTLIDSEAPWVDAMAAWLRDRGATPDVSRLEALVFGHSWPDIHAALHAEYPSIPQGTLASDAVSLRPYYSRIVTDPSAQVIRSSVDFLRAVRFIAPCVIVSGSPHEDVAAAAGVCGVTEDISFVLGAEDYGRGKPAPDGFLKAATMLDVDASECVVVEDSTAGVRAGRAAGMHVLGLDRNTAVRQDFAGADWIVHDLSEIDIDAVFDAE